MPNFDFHARNVFLTYPQCTLSPGDGLALLTSICGDRWAFAVVAREQHEDGGDHLHVLICFRRKFRTRNERYFDLDNGRGGGFHPNIQTVRGLNDVYAYVTKEQDFIEVGDKPAGLLSPGEQRPSKRDAAFAALDAEFDTVEDFMSALRQRHPYEFFTRGNTIRANVEQAKRRRWDYAPEHPSDSFVIPGAVQDWLDVEFSQEVTFPLPTS